MIETGAVQQRQTYFRLCVLLNGAEKTHGIFNRWQREQAGGSKMFGSPSHRIYSRIISLHGVGCGERLDAVRQTFCCLHSAHAVFFRTDAGGVCWGRLSSILAVGISSRIMEGQFEVSLVEGGKRRVAGIAWIESRV